MTQPRKIVPFSGANKYVLDEELAAIVNISMALEMPAAEGGTRHR